MQFFLIQVVLYCNVQAVSDHLLPQGILSLRRSAEVDVPATTRPSSYVNTVRLHVAKQVRTDECDMLPAPAAINISNTESPESEPSLLSLAASSCPLFRLSGSAMAQR